MNGRNKQIHTNNDIDLLDSIVEIWGKKMFILIFTFFCVLISISYDYIKKDESYQRISMQLPSEFYSGFFSEAFENNANAKIKITGGWAVQQDIISKDITITQILPLEESDQQLEQLKNYLKSLFEKGIKNGQRGMQDLQQLPETAKSTNFYASTYLKTLALIASGERIMEEEDAFQFAKINSVKFEKVDKKSYSLIGKICVSIFIGITLSVLLVLFRKDILPLLSKK